MSVSAINAEELQVVFNQAVTASARTASNYEVTINGIKTQLTNTNSNIALSEDGKIVTIRLNGAFDSFKSGDKVSIQISDGIVTKDGAKLVPFASETLSFTAVAPKLVSAKLDNGKTNLVVTFDQPVQSANNSTLVKVDGYEVAKGLNIFTATTTAGDYTYSIPLASLTVAQLEEVKAQGTHDIVFFDIANTTQLSQNPAVASVINGSYVVDNKEVAPQVKSVTAVNSNKFFVVFDQIIKDDVFKIEVAKGSHTFTNATIPFVEDQSNVYTTVYADSAISTRTINGKVETGYYVIITEDQAAANNPLNPLYKGLERNVDVTVKVSEFNSTGTGLLGTPSTTTVNLSKDAQTPKAVAKSISDTVLVLEFDQAVQATGTLASTDIIVRDKNSVIVKEADYTVAVSGKDFTITAINNYKFTAEPYTVEFKKDIVQYTVDKNSIATYSLVENRNIEFTATVGKAQADSYKYYTLQGVATITQRGTNEIIVDYKTPMDKNTALNAANYLLDGVALPTGIVIV